MERQDKVRFKRQQGQLALTPGRMVKRGTSMTAFDTLITRIASRQAPCQKTNIRHTTQGETDESSFKDQT
ncbi:hypothetical protein GCM10023352_08470 [Rothia endophytica]|uniref:Uncharacterized protein n=1 Tax=Rothia endophytica TaxID=1324766 RepID=A0ABP9BCK9_9MICC